MAGRIARSLDSVRSAAIMIGSSLIILACMHNSFTWHLQQFWGSSKNFWETVWYTCQWLCGRNNFVTFVFGSQVITAVLLFWPLNAFLMYTDLRGKDSVLYKFKVQADKNVPVDKARLKEACLVVLFNQVFSIPITAVLYPLMVKRANIFSSQLPTFQRVLLDLVVSVIAVEFAFYYSHRFLHHPSVYKWIHKKHHQWTAPVGIISLYAHPIEHVLSNFLPVALGPMIMGSHMMTTWLWFLLAIFTTVIVHSGYHLPLMPSPEAHDFHHLKFTNNYGVLGFLDRLHNTDNLFRETKQFQRHIFLFGISPITESFPDDPKLCNSPCKQFDE
ncbi:fatty acid hydroxylase domain-containing protein 2-like [Antedon mediterranea]|uniref:fatty acid hydroxylase domain-containing protein 2-like n=1 Tax=Antedon mediterranea TaxID=105859 RepID=UPI003AF5501B